MLIPEVWKTALTVDAVMRSLTANYCIIGGVALQRWGEPRVTRDVDLTIFVGFRNERKWIDRLTDAFRPRNDDHVNFALDLVTLKAFADRPQDWIDIKNVVVRQAEKLNREQIVSELALLVALKEEPAILDRMMKIFDEYPQQVTLDE